MAKARTARSGKARSGGGLTVNKLVQVGVRAGKRTLDAINPASADYLGQRTAFKKPPLVESTPKDFVPLGNSLVNNVGAGGPGKGRVTYPCGFQSLHGAVAKGEKGMEGKADRGARQILGPPANTGVVRKGQQSGE
jgi:hypothetical protein